jgi:DNA-binding IclR family transcriptional regulator
MESLTRKAGMAKQNVLEPDALRLLAALARLPDAPFPERVMPGEVATALGIPPAKAWGLFRELFHLGYYEYDISAYSGRLTETGRLAARDLIS